MRLYCAFLFLILFFISTCLTRHFDLTPNDKQFLLELLPKDHKLSAGMQHIIDQSSFDFFEDRSKRQYPLFSLLDGTAAITTPTSQPTIGPKVTAMVNLKTMHGDGTRPTNAYNNLNELVINSDIEKHRFINSSQYSWTQDNTLFPMTIHIPPVQSSSALPTTNIASTHAATSATTTKPRDTKAPTKGTTQSQTGKKGKNRRAQGRNEQRLVKSRSVPAMEAMSGSECQPEMAPSLPTNVTNNSTIGTTDMHNKIAILEAKPELMSSTVASEAGMEAKLQEVLQAIQTLEESAISAEGLPCSVSGMWESNMAGASFCISFSGSNTVPVAIKASKPDSILNGTWQLTLTFPIEDIPIFLLTGINQVDQMLAVFTGECRTCEKKDTVVGHWLFERKALSFEELHRSQDFFGDTWMKLK